MRSTQFVPKYDPTAVELAAAIEKGCTILLATDTIWGMICDPFNKEAYDQLYSIKKKPKDKPLIILVSNISMLKQFVEDIHPRIETLLVYHNRPLTIVYDSPRNLPQHLLAKDGTIAIRISKDGLCNEIMEHTGKPLAITSAKIFGKNHALEFEDLPKQLLSNVDFVVSNSAQLQVNTQASVIARFNQKGELEILRE